MYAIKGWGTFQHYSDRNPPWVKLHRSLLDDFDFQSLPVASRALAPMLWLLAAEHENPRSGFINGPVHKVAFRLRMTKESFEEAIKPLIEAGFVILASAPLADCKHIATPETENRGRGQRHNFNGGSHGKQKSFSEEGNRVAAKYRSQIKPIPVDAE